MYTLKLQLNSHLTTSPSVPIFFVFNPIYCFYFPVFHSFLLPYVMILPFQILSCHNITYIYKQCQSSHQRWKESTRFRESLGQMYFIINSNFIFTSSTLYQSAPCFHSIVHYLLDKYRPIIEDAFFELSDTVKANYHQVENQGLWLILSTTFQILGWLVYGYTYYKYRIAIRRFEGMEAGCGLIKGTTCKNEV